MRISDWSSDVCSSDLEVFGPARGIMRLKDLDEAIEVTNAHEYSNGAVIFTRSGHAAHRLVTEVEAGMLGVTVPVTVPVATHNFGGLRSSKFGDAHMFVPDEIGIASCRVRVCHYM